MSNPLELFQKEAPEVAQAFNGLIQSIVASKGLDEKTKQLIYIALKTVEGDSLALQYHIPAAKELGATKAEVIDAILVSLTVCGIKGVANAIPLAVEFFEKP